MSRYSADAVLKDSGSVRIRSIRPAGNWETESSDFSRSHPPSADKLRKVLVSAAGDRWTGLQVYYPMRKREVQHSTGLDLIESMLAVFGEVTPAMNLCMQIQLGEKSK